MAKITDSTEQVVAEYPSISDSASSRISNSSLSDMPAADFSPKFSDKCLQRIKTLAKFLQKTNQVLAVTCKKFFCSLRSIIFLPSRIDSLSQYVIRWIYESRDLVTEISVIMALMTYGLGYFLGRASVMFLGTVIAVAGLLLWCSPVYGFLYWIYQRVLLFLLSRVGLNIQPVSAEEHSADTEVQKS